MGIFGDDTSRRRARRRQGCGVLQGFWFHPPGTATGCGYELGEEDATACA